MVRGKRAFFLRLAKIWKSDINSIDVKSYFETMDSSLKIYTVFAQRGEEANGKCKFRKFRALGECLKLGYIWGARACSPFALELRRLSAPSTPTTTPDLRRHISSLHSRRDQ